jgi:hypothetical protein
MIKPISFTLLSLLLILSACATTSDEIIRPDPQTQTEDKTYAMGEVQEAAEKFFAKGAEGVGTAIEKVFSRLGRPNAYITGTEGSGALVIGMRWGKGELSHKLEGTQPVFWIGPSIGVDTGGNITKSFTLIYNLYDPDDLYQRFPGAEGNAFFIGGISVNYQQSDNIILVPIKLGVGLRMGVNAGWVKYRKKKTYLPF